MDDKRAAAFLDRDGVINVDHGYTHRAEDLKFTPSAVDAIKLLNDRDHLVIIVTNQAGVARGYFDISDVETFHQTMQAALESAGARIDAFYYCPFHPEGVVDRFTAEHFDRKPSPGMLLRAIEDFGIASDRSFLVGDKDSDIAAASAAGIAAVLVPSNTCDLVAVVEQRLGLSH